MTLALNIIFMAIVFCAVVGMLATSILRGAPQRLARTPRPARRPASRPAGAPSAVRSYGSARRVQA